MSSSSTMQLSTYVLKTKVFKRTWGVILIARLPKSHVGRRGDHAGATFHCGHWCIDTFASFLSRSFLSLLLIHRNKMNKRLLLKNAAKHPVLIVAYTWRRTRCFPFHSRSLNEGGEENEETSTENDETVDQSEKTMSGVLQVRSLKTVRSSAPAVCWGLWGLWGSTEVAQKSLESMCVWQNSAVLQQCLTHWRSKWLGWHWSCHSTWWYVKPLSLAVQKRAACFCFEHPLWQYDFVDLDWPILAWLLLTFA